MLTESFPAYVAALENLGYGAWLEEAGDFPVPSFYVVFHVDDQGRKYYLQAFDGRELAKLISSDTVIPTALLQFTCEFPYTIPKESFPEILRLLNRLNMLLPIGSLLLSETDNTVSHRSVLPANDTAPDAEVIENVIDITRRFCIATTGLIEAVSTGEMTVDANLDSVADLLETDRPGKNN